MNHLRVISSTTQVTDAPQERPIPGYPGYFADIQGSIWSTRSGSSLLLSARLDRDGYPAVGVKDHSRKPHRKTVHQLVALAFLGPKPDPKLHTRHLNGIKTDNRPENLVYGTAKENGADKVRLGEPAVGSDHGLASLTEAEVAVIKAMLQIGSTQTYLAKLFSVTSATIGAIAHGKTWKHVRSALET